MTTPAYRLRVKREQQQDGAALPLAPIEISVRDVLGPEADTLRITVPGTDAQGALVAHPPHRRIIGVELGYGTDLAPLGDYAVSALDFRSGPQGYTLTITAMTPDVLGTIAAPNTRSWLDTPVRDVLATIAARHGLQSRISASIADHRVVQAYQVADSDMSFLTRIAKRYGAVFKIQDHFAVMVVPGEEETISGNPAPQFGVDLDDREGLSWDLTFLDRPDYAGVVAEWIDTGAPDGPGGQPTTVHAVSVGSVDDGSKVHQMRHTFDSEAEARFAAESEFDDLKREVSELEVAMPGRPEIRAGAIVTARSRYGDAHPAAGRWYVAEALHTYDADGLSTRLTCHKPRSDGRAQ